MKPLKCLLIVLLSYILNFNPLFAQSAKEFYKKGIEAQKTNNCKDAIKSFNMAIDLKGDYAEAYLQRANCYFKLKQFELALQDYNNLHRINPLNENFIIKSALTYMELKRYADAQNMLMKLEADDMNLHIAEGKTKMAQCKIMMKNYEDAVQYLSESISIFPDDDQIFYYKGVASDSLRDYQTAVICFTKSLEFIEQKLQKKTISNTYADSLKFVYYRSLAHAQVCMFDFIASKENITKALKIEPKNAELYLFRAGINLQSGDLNNALADLNQCEMYNLRSYNYYFTKAKVLKKAGQFNLAIENLDPIIKSDTAFYAKLLKGQCLESIGKYEEAQILYQQSSFIPNPEKKKEIDVALKRMRNRIYELKRENVSPEIKIISPNVDIDNKIMIPKNQTLVEVKGKVFDKSLIKSILINDLEADFERDSINPNFRIKLNLNDKSYLNIKILDVYSNLSEQNFEFNRAEKNKPNHKLFLSYDEKNKEIFIDKSAVKKITISGKIEDESYIKRVMINNKIASFNLNESNPFYEAEIDVSLLDSVKILIIDEFDNTSNFSYYINSKKAQQIESNPMGKTWLIFIANSNYESFGTLTGPEKDMKLIKSALQTYAFDNFITKQNMTLSEMEKFFRIELRDLIKEQNVQSVMIWFAGHGKFLNETGYWLPVNAKKDDELSYYPIPYLKSNLSSYGKSLKNILIISDACESGPAFSLNTEELIHFDCKKLEQIKNNRSAYVFSSTTNEKASDNSIFCESFADQLNNNQNYCLSMSEVVKFVSGVVEKRQSQRCKYGKIKDINDNIGSFYFLKKSK
ncbi:MAG TPA: tetratricopeptide repeat protein [Bacteroidia bacterium]|nr:tetratricopeptide repeat protein [Bacteroidia bacterium]